MPASNDPDNSPDPHDIPESAPPDIGDEKYQEALNSTRWFAYIAVGITLAAMGAGLAVMARLVYLFFRSM